jgi:flagellar biosynthesis/type III secretory pathway M-ring protein FliF/YscJ
MEEPLVPFILRAAIAIGFGLVVGAFIFAVWTLIERLISRRGEKVDEEESADVEEET